MADIPEHLLKRAAERRAQLAAQQGGGAPAEPAGSSEASEPEDPDKIPSRLLTPAGGAPAGAPAGATATAVAPAPVAPGISGPAGHTQRLLTVVKAGSIQDVKAT